MMGQKGRKRRRKNGFPMEKMILSEIKHEKYCAIPEEILK